MRDPERQGEVGLQIEDDQRFLEGLARLESEEDRLWVVENVIRYRKMGKAGEPTDIHSFTRGEPLDSEREYVILDYIIGHARGEFFDTQDALSALVANVKRRR